MNQVLNAGSERLQKLLGQAADILSGFISFAQRNQMSEKVKQRTFRELAEQEKIKLDLARCSIFRSCDCNLVFEDAAKVKHWLKKTG